MSAQGKAIFVTGANTGIGFALCRQLVCEKGARVFLGSRDTKKGEDAVNQIKAGLDSANGGSVELVIIDTSSDESVKKASEDVSAKLAGGKLYSIVNNAGTGLAHGVSDDTVVNVNLYGPKRVCETFIPLLDPQNGRIVNVGSGAGPSYVKGTEENGPDRKLLTSWKTTWDQIDAYVKEVAANGYTGNMGAYGLSKAALTVYGMILSKQYPQFKVSTLSPGFIDTNIAKGFGASKTPEEGTVSLHHCLFGDLKGSGFYYGSDAVRSPLTFMRNPGEPEYNPDVDGEE